MAKLLYETALLICSGCVIFFSATSAVLLMLAWPNDRILGLSTRLVIGIFVLITGISSIGFFGVISESTRALLIYASLLVLFPVSILLVELLLRLWTPVPVSVSPVTGAPSSPNSLELTPLSTQIYSNSFTSNSMTHPSLTSSSFPTASNLTKNSISASSTGTASSSSSSPSLNALLPLPSMVPQSDRGGFNLSSHMLLLSEPGFVAKLPTGFQQPIKDGYQPSSSAKHLSGSNGVLFNTTWQHARGKSSRPVLTTRTVPFWSNILSSSISPRVASSVQYVLIGMLAFVLVQIVIAYLLASEIRSLRAELALLTACQDNKEDENECDELGAEMANLQEITETSLCHIQSVPNQVLISEANFGTTFAQTNDSYCSSRGALTGHTSQQYCTLYSFEPNTLQVQVHNNPSSPNRQGVMPDSSDAHYFIEETSDGFANRASQFASSTGNATPSGTSSLARTNRRNRIGSFRVTFDSAPEYFEVEASENYLSSVATTAPAASATATSTTVTGGN